MLSEPFFYLFVSLLALLLFWVTPRTQAKSRQKILLFCSIFAVALYSVGGLLVFCWLILVPMIAQRQFSYVKRTWILWLYLIAVLAPLVSLRLLTDQGVIWSFGVAFATVKSIGLLITAYSGRQKFDLLGSSLLIFFFPLVTVGPVERLATFAEDKFSVKFELLDFSRGLFRIALGLFVVMFICNGLLLQMKTVWFGDVTEILKLTQAESFILVYVSFLFTYLNFVGFSDIAIGTSQLFGLNVSENFKRPFLATNPADFWRRYHISMGNWINQYLFFPIAIFLKRSWGSYVATVLTFILFGLWHSFTWNYFAWGLGNGIGVAAYQLMQGTQIHNGIRKSKTLSRIFGVAGLVFTLTWVGFFQTFANLPSFTHGIELFSKISGF
jgi:alginate O-acetyltransferase complex protein AlgI